MYSNSTIIDCYSEIMSNHKTINDDMEFNKVLAGSGSKLVIVDYNATWCGPCKQMHPLFIQLAHKFPRAIFLGVDVDLCHETAIQQGVSGLPTFILYNNRQRIDFVRGAHPQELEKKIRFYYDQIEPPSTSTSSSSSTTPHPNVEPRTTIIGGGSLIIDICPYIEKQLCECLNECETTPFSKFIDGKSILHSQIDSPQLLLMYGFNHNVNLHSFKMKSSVVNGPKILKFFVNQSNKLNFTSALTMMPTQEITLHQMDLIGKQIELRPNKFQHVHNLQIWITCNQIGSVRTQIDSFILYGIRAPSSTTNMLQQQHDQ